MSGGPTSDERLAHAVALMLTNQIPHGSTLAALRRRGYVDDGNDLTDEGVRFFAWHYLMGGRREKAR